MLDYGRMLKGREAAVVGCETAMGLETARLFVSHGARVAIFGKSEAGLAETLRHLSETRGDVSAFAYAPGDGGSVRAACGRALEALPSIDVCVFIEQIGEPDGLDKILSAGIVDAARFAKAFLPSMLEARRGNFVFLIPDLLDGAPDGMAARAANAGAVFAYARNMAADYIRYRVRANCVLYPHSGLDESAGANIANAALWLSCGLSRFVVGDYVRVGNDVRAKSL